MSILAGPLFALALVLAAAGVAKLVRPASADEALAAAGLPSWSAAGRALGVVELAIAGAALAWGTSLAAGALAVSYALLALFSFRLVRRSGGTAPCGCFSETTAPTTLFHVAVNAAGAAGAAAAVVWPPGGAAAVLQSQPMAGVPFLLATATAALLWYAVLEALPELRSALAEGATTR